MNPVFRVHIDLADEVQLCDRFIQLRIGHALQACPDFSLPVLGLPVSRLFVLFGLTAHDGHRGAWTASDKWA
jgi:hypothetical protein